MNSLFQTFLAVGIGLLLSTQWVVISMLCGQGDPFYWALSIQFLLGALVGLVMQLVIERRLPALNFKLVSSAVTIGMVCFLFPAIYTFSALRELPPVLGAMTFAMIPLWFWMFRMGRGIDRPIFFLMTGAATVLYFLGTSGHEHIYSHQLYLLVALFAASFLFAVGVVLCKKLFWIHSPKGLSFWGMIFASLFLGSMALMQQEPNVLNWSVHYLLKVLYLGIVSTGLAAYAYRYLALEPRLPSIILVTILMPLGALGITFYLNPAQALWNIYSISGIALYVIAMTFAAKTESHVHWMAHFLNNSRRQGDRVVCQMKGFMKKEKGSIAKIEVMDISIGGLGFKCDTEFHVADHVFVTFPLGQNWTQITFECQIMHRHKTPDTEYPWSGGVEFRSLGEETRQTLVEFLAKIGRPVADAA